MNFISGRRRMVLAVVILVFGCTGKQLTQKTEYDDLYYTSKDKKHDIKQKTEQLPKVEEKKQVPASTGQSDTYNYNFNSKTPPNTDVYKAPIASDTINNTPAPNQNKDNNSNQNVVPNSNSNYNSDVNNNSNYSPVKR
jgi:hypothetical protein